MGDCALGISNCPYKVKTPTYDVCVGRYGCWHFNYL